MAKYVETPEYLSQLKDTLGLSSDVDLANQLGMSPQQLNNKKKAKLSIFEKGILDLYFKKT